jgi:diguanylate cyclase (GGDEF)-like protein
MPRLDEGETHWAFGLATITILFGIGALHACSLPDRQREQGQLVDRTHQVLNELNTLALHLTEAESGQRGFLLTGGIESYLTPYVAAAGRIHADLDRLMRVVAVDERHRRRLPALRADIAAKLGELKETIDLRRRYGDNDAAMEVVLSDRGRDLMTRVSRQIDEMKAEEVARLKARLLAAQEAAERTRVAFLIGGLITYASICALLFAVGRVSRQRKRLAEAEARAGAMQRIEAQRLAQIVGVQREIAGHSLDLLGAMQAMTERTQVLTNADGSIVELMEGDALVYRAASGLAAPFIGLRLDPGNSMSGLAIRRDAVLKCDDSEADARVDRLACRKVGLRSMVVVPLRHRGRPVGVLKVMSAQPNGFRDEDVCTLELLAGLLSATLSDAKAADALRSANRELEETNAGLEVLARTDGLTGLENHRRFKELLDREFERSRRQRTPLSLILLDVDHFKGFNDRFGHPAGDAVLERVATLLRQTARKTDLVGRYGGEEFAILLPETSAEGAEAIADRIRRAIADDGWPLRPITASLGIGTLDEDTASPAALLKAADDALYLSKQCGRNRVTLCRRAINCKV